MNYPKISIVTPSFNQGKYLEQTILSILGQKYPNLEYIIIDGGSTDNSVEVIRKYEKQLSYWVSEKDKGQSDAINKGLKKVTGNLFNWINSDDLLEEGALFKIAEAYMGSPDAKLFVLGLSYLDGEKKVLRKWHIYPADGILFYCDPTIVQPSMFYTLDAVKKIGEIDMQLHYAMDYEWLLKFLFIYDNTQIYWSQVPVAVFRLHSEAKTSEGEQNFINDIANILFSLSKYSDLSEYCMLLNQAYKIYPGYSFNIAKNYVVSATVERMLVYFLLHHSHLIFDKKQYLFAKRLLSTISFSSFALSANEKRWLEEMRKNTDTPTWLLFRAKQKFNHIFK